MYYMYMYIYVHAYIHIYTKYTHTKLGLYVHRFHIHEFDTFWIKSIWKTVSIIYIYICVDFFSCHSLHDTISHSYRRMHLGYV